jgi:hypothetical protein
MAQKVQVLLTDDLDGGEASETLNFGLEGTAYEIDLSKDNADGLRDALARYVGAARKVSKAAAKTSGGGRSKSSGSGTTLDRDQAAAIRTWAKGAGLKVSDRGRIPASVVEQYNASV